MNVKVENLPKSQTVVTVEVEPERVTTAHEDAFRRIARDVLVPGFRKGKAPRPLVERYVKADFVRDDAEERLMDDIWHELRAGELKDLALYDAPQVKVVQHSPFTFEMRLTLQPTCQLGDYKDTRIAPELVTVTDEDVNGTIERLREDQAQWQPVEHRPVRQGDMITVQVHGAIGDKPIIVPQGYSLVVDPASSFIVPGFVMRLVDMEIGKEQEFAVQPPEDAASKEMAGATGTAFVTVQEIKEKVLPDVDDAFAKLLLADTVDALKQKVRDAQIRQREDDARGRMESKILDAVAAVSTVSVPDAMVDRQVESLYKDRTEYLRQQGISMDLYLRITDQTEAQVRQGLRPQAEKRLRNYLLVEELGRAEGIVIEDAAVHAEIERVAALQPDPEGARRQLSTNEVHEDVRNQLYVTQLFDRLIALVTEGQEPVVYAPASAAMPSITDSVAESEPAAEAEPEKPKLIIATH